MKKIIALTLALVLALTLAACGGNGNNSNPSGNGTSTSNPSSGTTNTPSGSASPSGGSENKDSKFTSISDMSAEYNRLFEAGHALDSNISLSINMGLVMMGPVMSEAFGKYQKSGSKLIIKEEETLADDGYTYEKAGDIKATNGEADFSAGTLWFEKSVSRGGAAIEHNRNDYLFSGGKVISMQQNFSDYNSYGDQANVNTAAFVINSEAKIEYVYGQMETNPTGASKEFMKFDAAMSTEQAKAMMESAGFTIVYYGSAEGDTVTSLL